MKRLSIPRLPDTVVVLCAFWAALFPIALRAEDGSGAAHAFTFDQRFQGSSSSFGQILKLNSNIAYDHGKHFGVDAGVPFYFVNYSAADATTKSVFKSGIGNAYADLRLSFAGPVNYTSTITATAPTGNRQKGLSTGRVALDWNNGIQKVIAYKVAPFANLGIANTISDTPFFLRPFSTNGIVGHFEGGATVSISRIMTAGGSAYSIVPSGEQTIVSKIVEIHTEAAPTPTLPANSRGRGVGLQKPRPDLIFESTVEVIGIADLTSDHGFSTWLGIGLFKNLDLTAGYSRSNRYALDTFFWGLGLRVGPFSPRRVR